MMTFFGKSTAAGRPQPGPALTCRPPREIFGLSQPVRAAALLMLCALTAACTAERILGGAETPAGGQAQSPSVGDRIAGLFGGGAQSGTGTSGPPPITIEEIDCPTVTIRPGTSTFSISAPGADPSVLTVRYQATFGQLARECKLAGTTLTIRVGVEGRVILGPAGGPGQFEMPVRYAVVREGPEPVTIVTRLRWLRVEIPQGVAHVPFSQIEEELSFPLPRLPELQAYVVYVGFDPAAVKEPERKRPAKPAPRPARRAS